MKIPYAPDYLGSKTPSVAPNEAIENPAAAGAAVNQGMQSVSHGLSNIAYVDLAQQKEEQDKINRRIEHKILTELERKEQAQKQNGLLKFQADLSNAYSETMTDDKTPMPARWQNFSDKAKEIQARHMQAMGPDAYLIENQALQLSTHYKQEYSRRLYEHTTSTTQGETLATLSELKKIAENDPAQLPFVKAAINAMNPEYTGFDPARWEAHKEGALIKLDNAAQGATLARLEDWQRTALQSPDAMQDVVNKIKALTPEQTGFDPKTLVAVQQRAIEGIAQTAVLQQANTIDKSKPAVAFKQFDALHKQILQQDKEGNYVMLPDLDPKVRQSLASTIWTQAHAMKREADADIKHAQAANLQTFNIEYSLVRDRLQNGEPVSAGELHNLKTLAARSGLRSQVLLNNIDNMVNKYGSVDYIMEKQRKDPFFGTNAPTIQPQDFDNPQKFAELVNVRKEIGAKQQAKLGLDYTPILNGQDITKLIAYIERNPAYLARVQELTQYTGKRNALMIATQAAYTNSVVGAAMERMISGDTKTAVDMLKGQKLLKDKVYEVNSGMSSDLSEQINSALEGMYAGNPRQYDITREAIKALYAKNASDIGYNDPKSVDSGALDKAIKSVVGETVRTGGLGGFLGGYKTTLPAGYTPDRFWNAINQITPDMLDKNWGGIRGAESGRFLRDLKAGTYKMVLVDLNTYQVFRGNNPVMTNSNKPFMLYFGD